jgi:hypothetical protein
MCTVSKTQIFKTSDLKEGDVIYWYEKGQEKKNPTWPKCNFHRIAVVTSVFQIEDGSFRFDYRQHYKLYSENNDASVVYEALKSGKILEGGSFGCNQLVEKTHPNFATDYYRLDNIKNREMFVYNLPNLVGNPAYDLMM